MTTTRKRTIGARVLMGALAAGVLVAAGAAPLAAQGVPTDQRWQAWLGCWEPFEHSELAGTPAAPVMCFIPAAGGAAVDLVAVSAGRILSRHRIDTMGERRSVTIGDCTGWERADWSAERARVYVGTETECPGTGRRVSSRVMAMASPTSWLDVETVVLADSGQGAHVRRYQEVAEVPMEPAEIRAALAGLPDPRAARAAAAALTLSDVIEASHRLDTAVVVAWLAALRRPFQLNSRALLALADSGVPGQVTDVMVALTYGRRFQVAETEALPPDLYRRSSYALDPYGLYYPWTFYDQPGSYVMRHAGVMIVDLQTKAAPGHGQVVNGGGYVDARGGTGPSVTVSSGTQSAGGSMSATGATGGSGTDTGRTAHHRP